MDQSSAPQHQGEATPIFGAYRRGYDPEQVDRYVADQQRRLDDATERASEAERKLAAAVGQLRELHRRVAVLESEDRSPQPAPLDTLGERVQRILQEAWEGAYALRQATEQEMAELRERTAGEAEAIVVEARQQARAIEEEIERRRNAYLERVEEDRSRAVAQITHLHHQRDVAVGELLKVKAAIEATVGDISGPRRSGEPAGSGAGREPVAPPGVPARRSAAQAEAVHPRFAPQDVTAPGAGHDLPEGRRHVGDIPDPTMPVHRLERALDAPPVPSPSELVHSHRASRAGDAARRGPAPLDIAQPPATVFDFEEEQDR